MDPTQGDVLLFQTVDDGEINIVNGVIEMSGGLQTSVYLSLFGGNEDDNGLSDSKFTWWGNAGEVVQYRSETQHLLQSLPALIKNLNRIKDAVNRDLKSFIDDKIASAINVVVSMPGLNKISITIDIEAIGESHTFKFVENWKARS